MESKSGMNVIDIKQSQATKPEQPNIEMGFCSTFPSDEHAEKRLVRKLDMNILPLLMVIYLISFLDR